MPMFNHDIIFSPILSKDAGFDRSAARDRSGRGKDVSITLFVKDFIFWPLFDLAPFLPY